MTNAVADPRVILGGEAAASGGRYRSRGLSSTHSIAASPPTVLCGRRRRYAAHTLRKLLGGSNSLTAATLRFRQ
ncbi:hypothetical protein J6590_081397 [Homalodisca vitripennis]|nr:hypothetical protein J6590_081397 [Homalodisca vitripennis]